jgi:hypothetical protein
MNPIDIASARPHVRCATLAVLALVALAACDTAPAPEPKSLLPMPLPMEPDTTTFEEQGAPATDVSLTADAQPEEAEDDGDPYAYPAWKGFDLDCADVGHTVKVTGGDPHRLDKDGGAVLLRGDYDAGDFRLPLGLFGLLVRVLRGGEVAGDRREHVVRVVAQCLDVHHPARGRARARERLPLREDRLTVREDELR